MTDPLAEIKAELARVDSEGFSLSYRAARAYIDTLIDQVEGLRTQLAAALHGWQHESGVVIERNREVERLRGDPLPDHLLPDNLKDALAEIQRLRRYRSLGQIPRLDLLLHERDDARDEAERLRGALRSVLNHIGPHGAPPDCENRCEGCRAEMHEACRIADEALGRDPGQTGGGEGR
jgi:hypothetical protein